MMSSYVAGKYLRNAYVPNRRGIYAIYVIVREMWAMQAIHQTVHDLHPFAMQP